MAYSEKRRANRLPIDLFIGISELFKQDNEVIRHVDAPIEVIDISRGGIGFLTESELPVGYYFNAKIQAENDEKYVFYSVIKILRCREYKGKLKLYGCEFVGFPPVLNYIFDELEQKMKESEKET